MNTFVSHLLEGFTRLLYRRIVIILTILFCIGIGIALSNMSRLSSSLINTQAQQSAMLYAKAIKEARSLYSSEAVSRAETVSGITVTHDYPKIKGGIPVPATFLMELGYHLSEKSEGMEVRSYSDYPFPWRQKEGGARDVFEQEALKYLRQHPRRIFSNIEDYQGHRVFRYAEADILEPSCVSCHNSHPDSPKTDWKVGDVRGILEIVTPLDGLVEKTDKWLQGTFVMLAGLSGLAIVGIGLVIAKLQQTSKELEKRVVERTAQLHETNQELELEQQKSERLLLNVLPESIADRLKQGHHTIADWFSDVTVLFADIVGFTELSSQISATELVSLLNELFSDFDKLSEKYHLEKIKTIGDNYMVAGGLPAQRPDHAPLVAQMALEMQASVKQFNFKNHTHLNIRIGINSGPVVAGVIGTKKFIYDLWGDTVNIASRMESHGIAGQIQVSEDTYRHLHDQYCFEERGTIQVKGKGEMKTYLLISQAA